MKFTHFSEEDSVLAAKWCLQGQWSNFNLIVGNCGSLRCSVLLANFIPLVV